MEVITEEVLKDLEKAKKTLKNVDENIKKVTGRDPSQDLIRRRDDGDRNGNIRLTKRLGSSNPATEPPSKRFGGIYRRGAVTRTSESMLSRHTGVKSDEEEDVDVKPKVQSSVVSAQKSVSKSDLIKAQNVDEKGKARNRRMFGVLLGTLSRFQKEEGKTEQAIKQKKRKVEIEKKIEEKTNEERQKAAAEKRVLYTERRTQKKKIDLLEQKMSLADESENWKKQWKCKANFIMTKTKPSIFFKPKDSTGRTIRAHKESSERIEELIKNSGLSAQQTVADLDFLISNLNGEKQQSIISNKHPLKDNINSSRNACEEIEPAADLEANEPNAAVNVNADEDMQIDNVTLNKSSDNRENADDIDDGIAVDDDLVDKVNDEIAVETIVENVTSSETVVVDEKVNDENIETNVACDDDKEDVKMSVESNDKEDNKMKIESSDVVDGMVVDESVVNPTVDGNDVDESVVDPTVDGNDDVAGDEMSPNSNDGNPDENDKMISASINVVENTEYSDSGNVADKESQVKQGLKHDDSQKDSQKISPADKEASKKDIASEPPKKETRKSSSSASSSSSSSDSSDKEDVPIKRRDDKRRSSSRRRRSRSFRSRRRSSPRRRRSPIRRKRSRTPPRYERSMRKRASPRRRARSSSSSDDDSRRRSSRRSRR